MNGPQKPNVFVFLYFLFIVALIVTAVMACYDADIYNSTVVATVNWLSDGFGWFFTAFKGL